MPASPTVNGNSQAAANSSNTISQTITTTGAGVILAHLTYCSSGQSGAAVSSVTASGLTFAQLAAATIEQASGTSNYSHSELWYAISAGAVSAKNVTALFNKSGSGLALNLIGVGGTNATSPFDPNANAVKTQAVSVSGPSVTYSTTNADDLLIEFNGAAGNHPGTDTSTGFTLIQHFNDGGIIFGAESKQSLSAPQTGTTVSGISSGLNNYILVALTADSGGGGGGAALPIDMRRNRTYLRR